MKYAQRDGETFVYGASFGPEHSVSRKRVVAEKVAAMRARAMKRKAQSPVTRAIPAKRDALPPPAIFEPPAFARIGKSHLIANLSAKLAR